MLVIPVSPTNVTEPIFAITEATILDGSTTMNQREIASLHCTFCKHTFAAQEAGSEPLLVHSHPQPFLDSIRLILPGWERAEWRNLSHQVKIFTL